MRYATVEVDVDLDEFGDDDLIDELKYRGYKVVGNGILNADEDQMVKDLTEKIWLARREGRNYDSYIPQLLYIVLGKIV